MIRSLLSQWAHRAFYRHISRNIRCLLAILTVFSVVPAPAQTAEWAWMGGNSTFAGRYGAETGTPGVYGMQNEAAAGNVPGGRLGAVSWTGRDGKLWLFGGEGLDSAGTFGFLNDLWQYDPETQEWTWVAGSSTVPAYDGGQHGSYGTEGSAGAGNSPGGRSGAQGWTDANGNLWLFGGAGFDSAGTYGNLNDLWKFDVGSGQWTWMGGAETLSEEGGVAGVYGAQQSFIGGSYPGSRNYGVAWTDAGGNLWMFGGFGEDSQGQYGVLNDLWEYDLQQNAWAWMSGSSKIPGDWEGVTGVYGQQGTPAQDNSPSGRETATGWVDGDGNLWLFGGYGFLSTPNGQETNGFLNDLWEYDTNLKEWAWMGGSSTFANSCATLSGAVCGQQGVYGTKGTPAKGNLPGSRTSPVTWTDSQGNVWLFGGEGFDSSGGSAAYLSDVWKFMPATSEWVWVGGSNNAGQNGKPGVYGTLGIAAQGNLPGGREYAVGWTDASNNTLWLFGGDGMDSTTQIGYLNDLWQYLLNTPAPTFNPAPGEYNSAQSVSITDATPGAVIYYTTDGTTPTTSSLVYSAPINVSSTETIEAFAVLPNYISSSVVSGAYTITATITARATATPTFSPAAGTYSSAQTVAIADSTPNATIYYAINATPTTSSAQYTGAINVSSSETIEAIAVASGSTTSALASAAFTISAPAAQATFTLGASLQAMTVNRGSQGAVTLTVTPQNGFSSQVNFSCSGLPAGANCSFTPSAVTPSIGPATTQLTIGTSATSAAVIHPRAITQVPALAIAALLGLFGWRRRRGLRIFVAMLAACALFALGGCNAVLLSGPASITSTVTVTATSGALQQTASIELTVN